MSLTRPSRKDDVNARGYASHLMLLEVSSVLLICRRLVQIADPAPSSRTGGAYSPAGRTSGSGGYFSTSTHCPPSARATMRAQS
jgi:hypothetical protein